MAHAIAQLDSLVIVVARGQDNRFWYNLIGPIFGTWAGWVPLANGVFVSRPSVSTHGFSQVEFLGTGTDNRIWTATFAPGSDIQANFAPVQNGVFKSGPASAAYAAVNIGVFKLVGEGTDNTYYTNISE